MENKILNDCEFTDQDTESVTSKSNVPEINKFGVHSNDSGYVKTYFQFYSKLLNQQNMLQDYVRTTSYFTAVQNNL
jgi:hypothetical protein